MFNSAKIKLHQAGTVGLIPTDTVYGLVARAADPLAVARLYGLKRRQAKPGTVIAASISQLEELGLKHRYLKAVEQFWPGSVSVVTPTADPRLEYLHLGQCSLAVRLPNNKALHELLENTGPLLTSSANPPGEMPAETIDQAKAYFKDSVDFYIDGGDLSGHQASTVIRVVDDAIEVLRAGAVDITDTGTM